MDGKRKRSATKEVPPTTRATRSSSSSKITTTNGTTTPKPTPKKAKTTKKEGKKETAIENEVVQEIKKEEDKKPKEVTPEEVVEAEPELPAPQPELDFVGLEAIDTTVDTKNSQPEPEIPLPPNYLTLEHQFNALLTAIVFIRGRRLPPIWTNIQKPIEDFSGKNFRTVHLQQIMSVDTDTLRVDMRRVKTSKGEEDVLGIDIVVAHLTNLNAQRKQFHDNLITRVAQHHEKFIKTQRAPEPKKQVRGKAAPKKAQSKQPETPPSKHTATCPCLDTLPNIPSSTLPVSRRLSIGGAPATPPLDYNSDLTNNSTSNHTENITNKNLISSPPKKGNNNPIVLDAKVIQRRRIPMLTRMVASIYASQKKSAMPLAHLADSVVATAESPFEHKEVEDLIQHMTQLVPQFIQIYQSESEAYWVKIDRQHYAAALRTVNSAV